MASKQDQNFKLITNVPPVIRYLRKQNFTQKFCIVLLNFGQNIKGYVTLKNKRADSQRRPLGSEILKLQGG
jgi:hypothetical protein